VPQDYKFHPADAQTVFMVIGPTGHEPRAVPREQPKTFLLQFECCNIAKIVLPMIWFVLPEPNHPNFPLVKSHPRFHIIRSFNHFISRVIISLSEV
jgi:hypothetical protein